MDILDKKQAPTVVSERTFTSSVGKIVEKPH